MCDAIINEILIPTESFLVIRLLNSSKMEERREGDGNSHNIDLLNLILHSINYKYHLILLQVPVIDLQENHSITT